MAAHNTPSYDMSCDAFKFKNNRKKVDLLIDLVRENPVLYDFNLLEYRDATLRNEAWEDIAQKLNIPPRKCKDQWLKLRNCFTNALRRRRTKRNGALSMDSPWRYQEQMQYLIPYIETKSIMNTIQDDFEQSDENESYTNAQRKRKFKEETSNINENYLEEPLYIEDIVIDSPSTPKKNPPLPINQPDLDETDMFFLSMSKSVKKLPKIDQCNIKFELHKIINNIEMRIYSDQ